MPESAGKSMFFSLTYPLDIIDFLTHNIGEVKKEIAMRYTPPRFERLSDMAAIDVSRLTEDEARIILEGIRWPNGIKCPRCGSSNVTKLQGKSLNTRDGLVQCNACKKPFTVTVGTVMQGSHITLRQLVQAFYAMSASKKGVSALQLQRNLGIHSYKCAWHLAHRIRLAMQKEPFIRKLVGTIEVDETYVGGKGRWGKRGRGSESKTPVLSIVERGGDVRSTPVAHVNAETLQPIIKANVDKSSTIMSDEWAGYNGIGESFDGGHKTVRHGKREFARGDVHVNTAESHHALIKRGAYGIYHSLSKKHLHRYCNEYDFRWDNRKVSDGERTTEAIKGFEGKRLTYRDLTSGYQRVSLN
jgi:transposase-like protein